MGNRFIEVLMCLAIVVLIRAVPGIAQTEYWEETSAEIKLAAIQTQSHTSNGISGE
jgi:hypothetical protein